MKTVLYALYASGWLLVLVATFVINHFDLFGLRQVWLHLRGKDYFPLNFATPALYRVVRHPLYVGWFVVFWATPAMTVAHLVFALATTAYIIIAIRFEERDLVTAHPEYADYRRAVPMLIPRRPAKRAVALILFIIVIGAGVAVANAYARRSAASLPYPAVVHAF